MLDIKELRDPSSRERIATALAKRGYTLDVGQISAFEEKRKSLQTQSENLKSERNTLSKAIGQAKAKGADPADLMAQVGALGERLKAADHALHALQEQIQAFYAVIPNIPDESVPVGQDESDNQENRRWGQIPTFDFTPQNHIDLGTQLGWFDFEAAAKLSGSRFVVMHRNAVRLHRALVNFMIDIHTREHGYDEVYVPYLVHKQALYGTGQLPKFIDDQFMTTDTDPFVLIPTAEVPVTNLVSEEILCASTLPRQYVSHTPCFRREAGSYGKDTRGLIRQHQFEKVELIWVVKPDESEAALEKLCEHAQTILQRLDLPYRLMTLCTADMGISAAKTYDLEVWLPSAKAYREISSCSNTKAFQARRMHARYRHPDTGKPEWVHTLNGSGLAIGRTLIAIMENYQNADGQIVVPQALRPYLNNDEVLD